MAETKKARLISSFTPQLLTVLHQGYGWGHFRNDVIAGLTVAIVALPLSMAIAIASGVSPDRGLYTSIIGGFLVSLLGGSRFQIGGPAGAFIVLVSTTMLQHGLEGLLLATLVSGIFLTLIGFLRLGAFVKYIPYPVTIGFTAAIAVIIFSSQLVDLFGLHLDKVPAPILPKLQAIFVALPSFSGIAVAISALTIALILTLKHYRPQWPGLLIAIIVTAALTAFLHLPVDTIGTRFGGIPQSLPSPQLPTFSFELLIAIMPSALSFTLLGCIESLLSAIVADSMSGERHNSNSELVAQGVANIVTPLFGGFCVTGNIARTATNIRSGAYSPIAGMMHAVFLLAFILIAAPLAAYIPLPALAGILVIVAWNMIEKREIAQLFRASRAEAFVLFITFMIVVFRDLSEGILIGFSISALLFLHRMAQSIQIKNESTRDSKPAATNTDGQSPSSADETDENDDSDIVIIHINGAFFFGAAAAVGSALDHIGKQPEAYIIDMSAVTFIDTTGVVTIESFIKQAKRHDIPIYITAASPEVRRALLKQGLGRDMVDYRQDIDSARQTIQRREDDHNKASIEP